MSMEQPTRRSIEERVLPTNLRRSMNLSPGSILWDEEGNPLVDAGYLSDDTRPLWTFLGSAVTENKQNVRLKKLGVNSFL